MIIAGTKDLAIGYGRGKHQKVVLSGINMQFESGTLTCLLGRNGTGKSTLLRTLAGLQQPVAGEIRLEGKPLSSYSQGERAQRIAVVLTERSADGMLSAGDVVTMGRLPYTNFWGTLGSEDKKLVDEAMQTMGIADMKDRRFASLSDGEQQKVMVAKALAQHSRLLIMDEPTAFMDYQSKLELMQLLQQLAQERDMAVVMSTHDVDIARRYGNVISL